MKLQLKDLEKTVKGLAQLSDKKLPVRLAYAITKNQKVLALECEMLVEQWKSILEKNCIRDEKGNPVTDEQGEYQYDKETQKKEVLAALSELLQTETELAVMTVPLCLIEKCDEPQYDLLTGTEIASLEFMIEA